MMNEQDQSAEKTALGMVWVLVALVVGSIVAFGVHQSRSPHATSLAVRAAPGPQVDRIYFGIGDDSLPHESSDMLERIAQAARANSSLQVLISGFHDASGNITTNESLARSRAERVRHALEANGVANAQLVLAKPAITQGGSDPKEARRVEVRLQ